MKTATVLLVVMMVCMLGLVAQAETVVTTADGNGADTYLGNDTNKPPTYNYGGSNDMDIRNYTNVRAHIGYARWDITDIAGMDPTGASLRLWFTDAENTRDCAVYAVKDNPLDDNWDEMAVTYNTAPGFLPTVPEANGNYIIDDTKMTYLGTFQVPAGDQFEHTAVIATADPNAANPLEAVIKADTNNKITLAFICPTDGGGKQYYIRTKEGVAAEADPNLPVIAPSLVLPADVNPFWAVDPIPAMNEVVDATLTQLQWTNPEPNVPGGTITCDVYYGSNEPNRLASDYGLEYTLATGTSDTFVNLPTAPDPLVQYYWVVDVHDSSQPSITQRGRIWSFNTFNMAPTADAGEDQYVWLTKEVVSTTTSNDTYMRDDTDRGSEEVLNILYGGSTWGFGGYVQFDLSGLTAMGPGTLSNATLTLHKVCASRCDTITTDRFSLYGLLNVANATPQNWDEHTIGTSTVGDEWSWPFNAGSGLVENLDGADNPDINENIANDVVTITGAALEAFLQDRVDDNGLITFIVTQEASSGRGYGIASKENSNEALRPNLTLTYVVDGTPNNGDAVVVLDGTATDDGQPYGTLDYLWEQVSGPATVSIAPNDTEDVTVTIGTAGLYEFQFTADDGKLPISDTVQVYVGVDSCDAAQNHPDYEPFIADFNSDCIVDLKDFAVIAAEWLDCNSFECLLLPL